MCIIIDRVSICTSLFVHIIHYKKDKKYVSSGKFQALNLSNLINYGRFPTAAGQSPLPQCAVKNC